MVLRRAKLSDRCPACGSTQLPMGFRVAAFEVGNTFGGIALAVALFAPMAMWVRVVAGGAGLALLIWAFSRNRGCALPGLRPLAS